MGGNPTLQFGLIGGLSVMGWAWRGIPENTTLGITPII
jgi:hypothetical protein